MKWDSCNVCMNNYPRPCMLHDRTIFNWSAGRYSGSGRFRWWICRYCGAGETFIGTVQEERARAMAHESTHKIDGQS